VFGSGRNPINFTYGVVADAVDTAGCSMAT
jgi:hypothetical protein